MKFLCVPCDQPMKLAEVSPPDRGSLAVRYACPACGYEMAMLTNPHETQVVTSLGVRIGPEGQGLAAAAGLGSAAETMSPPAEGSGCPFAAMVADPSGAAADAGPSGNVGSAAAPVSWTPEAEARLSNIPSFVRPMARTGIERYARERGCERVDEAVLDAAREFFGM